MARRQMQKETKKITINHVIENMVSHYPGIARLLDHVKTLDLWLDTFEYLIYAKQWADTEVKQEALKNATKHLIP